MNLRAFYVLGWNDRVMKRTEDYGKTYRASDGRLLANSSEAKAWSTTERAEYVRGWEEASARILSLLLQE